MGDVDKSVERALTPVLEQSLGGDGVELYVASHHGAVDGTDAAFLSILQPQTTVISVGKDNSFHYPSGKSLAVLEKYSDTVLRTDHDGEICFKVSSGKIIPCTPLR